MLKYSSKAIMIRASDVLAVAKVVEHRFRGLLELKAMVAQVQSICQLVNRTKVWQGTTDDGNTPQNLEVFFCRACLKNWTNALFAGMSNQRL
jgi:hypothetical protein